MGGNRPTIFRGPSFLNGNIYTVSDGAPHAEAIAIKAGRILFVGANADAKKISAAATRTIDLKGRTVLPGLTDSHYHILGESKLAI